MVWCGVVWCGVVWCGVVWCGVVWCGVVWCGVGIMATEVVIICENFILKRNEYKNCIQKIKNTKTGY